MKPEAIAEAIIEEFYDYTLDGLDPWGSAHFFSAIVDEANYYNLSKHEVFRVGRYINKWLRRHYPEWRFHLRLNGAGEVDVEGLDEVEVVEVVDYS